MNCSQCSGNAVVELKYAHQDLCEECFSTLFEKRVAKANRDFGMLSRNDVVAAGVSGGKDSSAMLWCLQGLSKKIGFKLVPILIDEGIIGYRDQAAQKARELCENLGLELEVYSYKDNFGLSMDEVVVKKEDYDHAPGACSYCGVMRRNLLNKAAREVKATKLAVGHNLDDIGQTLLLNLLKNDSSSTSNFRQFTAVEEARDGFVKRIRPLIYIPERETAIFCMLKQIPFHLGECPHSSDSFRGPVKDFLNTLEASRPGTKHALLRSFLAMQDLAPKKTGVVEKRFCEKCGEPSLNELCRACELLSGLGS